MGQTFHAVGSRTSRQRFRHVPPPPPVIPGDGVTRTNTTEDRRMQARMKNPAGIIPEAAQAIQALGASFHGRGVPEETLALVHLRASQVNGCSSCVQAGSAG